MSFTRSAEKLGAGEYKLFLSAYYMIVVTTSASHFVLIKINRELLFIIWLLNI